MTKRNEEENQPDMTAPTTDPRPSTRKIDLDPDDLRERYYRLDKSGRAVARELGHSHDKVITALHEAGVPLKAAPKLDVNHAVKRWNKGDSIADIAHEAGMRRNSVRCRIRAAGWRVPKGDRIALRTLGDGILAILKAVHEGHNPKRYYTGRKSSADLAMDAAIELGMIRQDPHGNPKVTKFGADMYKRHVENKPLELSEAAWRDLHQRQKKIHQDPEQE